MKKIIYTVFINIVGIFAVLGISIAIPFVVYAIFNLYISTSYSRAVLPNYNQYSWSNLHFKEFSEIEAEYKSFIGWRMKQYSGITINIDSDGYRKTNATKNFIKPQYHFFGGSTMWGTGVTDDLTIPSLFSNKFNVSSKNYGESAYVSRQSLVLMINEYITGGISNGKNTIVYYDGVNDVQNYCRSEIVGMATSYQSTFQGLMENSHNMFKYIYSPLIDLINKFIQKGSSYDDLYDCENNIEKAKKVAGYIVNTWKKASLIASGNNDEFVAILQPVAHISNPKINHIKKFLALGRQQELKKQYEAVYPFIRALVKKEKNIHFLDFSNIYDGKDNIYIDFCHVSPQGHMLVIDEIYNKYKKDFNL